VSSFVVTSDDRRLFTICRRAWDFGAGVRRALEPVESGGPKLDVAGALRDALAVYYFPGMWSWDRSIVLPLVHQAFSRSLLRSSGTTDPTEAIATGAALIDRYAQWASPFDTFTPVRVETDFEVNVPDPARPGEDIATPDGRGVHFSGRLPVLVVDGPNEDQHHFVMSHRLVADDREFLSPEMMLLDEEVVSCCWGWEHFQLAARVDGLLFNEIVLDTSTSAAGRPTFRRSAVKLDRSILDSFGARIAALSREMCDPRLAIYPSPAVEHCNPCDFKAPCIVQQSGGDPAHVLATRYRRRTEKLEGSPGRIGGVSWSLGRGAAPPTFGSRAGLRQ
jgi:hypothetical protein